MIDLNEIRRLYEENKTTREVAKILGCGKSYVAKIVKELGISRDRTILLRTKLKNVNHCPNIVDKFKNYLDGLIISDGSIIYNKGAISSFYAQTCVNLEWLEEIQGVFSRNGISSVISPDFREGRKPAWVLRSFGYRELNDLRQRWYDKNNKIVPEDLDLSDKNLLINWIYGDGTLLHNTTLRLCTDSFTKKQVDQLSNKINKSIGIQSKTVLMGYTKTGEEKWRIAVCLRGGLDSLFKYVDVKPLKCFDYKWRKTC